MCLTPRIKDLARIIQEYQSHSAEGSERKNLEEAAFENSHLF